MRAKKILSLLLVLAMMLTLSSTMAFASTGATIAAESVSAAADAETVQVPIKLTAADSGVATMNLAITLTGASFTMDNTNTTATADSALTGLCSSNVVDGTLYIAYAAIENTTAPATLVTLTLPAPAAGTQYTVNVAKGSANGTPTISYFADNAFTQIDEVTFTSGIVSKEEATEPETGFVGTLIEPVADYFTTAGITTSFVNGNSYSAGDTFTVACENPCLVAISTDNGTSWISLAAAETETANTYLFALPADLNGAFQVEMAMKGDFNYDTRITLVDVTLISKINGGNIEASSGFDAVASDLNADGKISISDVTVIKKVNGGNLTFSW